MDFALHRADNGMGYIISTVQRDITFYAFRKRCWGIVYTVRKTERVVTLTNVIALTLEAHETDITRKSIFVRMRYATLRRGEPTAKLECKQHTL